jgi:hypothetical protein
VQSIHQFQTRFLDSLQATLLTDVLDNIYILPFSNRLLLLEYSDRNSGDIHSIHQRLQALLYLLCSSSTDQSIVESAPNERIFKRLSRVMQSISSTLVVVSVLSHQTRSTHSPISVISPADVHHLQQG